MPVRNTPSKEDKVVEHLFCCTGEIEPNVSSSSRERTSIMDKKSGEEALVSCGTTKGPVVMRMHRDWSPHGYDRVVDLFERVRALLLLLLFYRTAGHH